MQNKRLFLITFIIVTFIFASASSCERTSNSGVFTIAMDGKFSTLDPIGSVTVDANAERIRTLMYNSLVKKDDKFDYVGDLAKEIKPSEDGLSYTFTLKDDVKFHNGKTLAAEDVKYTLEKLFESKGGKAAGFFETETVKKKEKDDSKSKVSDDATSGEEKKDVATEEKKEKKPTKTPIITGIETPDEKTVVIKIARADLKNKLLPNLVPVAIIPKDAPVGKGSEAATKPPAGTGPYKFKSFNPTQNIVGLTGFEEYWEGAPNIKEIQIKILADANALQAELLANRVDLVPGATSLPPETLKTLNEKPNLKVLDFKGSNIQYLWFNAEADPVKNVKVRQAIAHAVNREKIIKEQLDGKAVIAHSILPAESWAYKEGKKYDFDIEKSKKLLDEAGYTDKDGDGVREMPKVLFKISSGSKTVQQYAIVIQSQLKEIGIPVSIESLEFGTMLSQVKQGQFIMTTGRWVGGNQDPIFLKDLFASTEIPSEERAAFNRGRYKNKEVDEVVNKALKELDREKAKEFYIKTQEIISEEIPLFPLWYSSNLVVAKKNVGNIKMNASGDWDFVRKMTLEKSAEK